MALEDRWHRTGVHLCLLIGLLFPGQALARNRPVTTNFAVAFISDWHNGGSGSSDYTDGLLDWFAAQTPKPLVVLHSGDLYLGSDPSGWTSLVEACTSRGMVAYSCLGNHDFDSDVEAGAGAGQYADGESPIDLATQLGSTGKPFWYRDVNSVRVLFLDNCYDTLGTGVNSCCNAYAQCNPPGAYFTDGSVNPSFADWVTPDTTTAGAQGKFIKDTCSGFKGTFIVALAHRSPYTGWDDATGDVRVTDTAGRSGGWALCTRSGVDIASTGDMHTCGMSYRMYKGVGTSASTWGTSFLTTRIAFKRTVAYGMGPDSPHLNATSMVWPVSAGDITSANETHSKVGAYAVFRGDRVVIQMAQYEVASGTVIVRGTQYLTRSAR